MSEPHIGSDNGQGEGPPTLSVGESEEIDRLCDRFEAAWRSGDRPRFEDYLPAGDGPFRKALEGELVAIELEWRRRRAGPQPWDDHAGDTAGHRPPGRGVLETLSASVGEVPHVLLRDTDGGPEPPLHRPVGGEPGQGTRYRIDGEIARGGMGAVLKGRDPDIGRDVALKVLREEFRDDAGMVRRFIEEAQIGGQLQHPGVVPIYEMGTLGDRRPFFSMKLVKGDTLARLLAARKDSHDGQPRLLTIFEAVAQTIAYAHARGVIHRDLKPSNVMVGAFGEVQVMDWGLAKVLVRGGAADDAEAGKVRGEETVIATARSGSPDSDLSRVGSVLGTPSYMAPEQARGEIEHVDERADVFALGSILCEILTHEPAFVGRNSGEIQRTAALGDTAGALARLDACGADAELISLAKDCLAREAQDRPPTAGAVSDRVTAYLAGVQDRLRRAELERVEERARRRVTTVVASAVILAGLLGGGGLAWNQRQKADRMARTARALEDALADASRLLGEAKSAPPGDAGRWAAAVAAAKRSEGLLAQGEADELLRRRVDSLVSEVERDRSAAAEKARQIEVDRVLLEKLESVRGSRVAYRDLKRTDADYAKAFRTAGLDLDASRPDEAGKSLASRTDPIELAGYLDDWAFVRRATGRPEFDWRRLVSAARGADPDPWRDALRAKLGNNDPAAVAEFHRMAGDPSLEDQAAPGLLLLARQLKFGCGDGERAASVLRRAARRYPGDFRVQFELACALGQPLEERPYGDDLFPDPEEAVRHLATAVAIRPWSVSTHLALVMALLAQRRPEEAVAEAREAVRIKPEDLSARFALADCLRWSGRFDEAEAECRAAIATNPADGSLHGCLATILRVRGDSDGAIREYREALRLKNFQEYEHKIFLEIADALQRKGEFAEALAMIRKVREVGPNLVPDRWHAAAWVAHIERMAARTGRLPARPTGEARPKDPTESLDLALICSDQKRFVASARYWAWALEADPTLGDDRRFQYWFSAACTAAMAAAGKGQDEALPDAASAADLRRQALRWLKFDLEIWSRMLGSGSPQDRNLVLRAMRQWRKDTDLVAVRDAEGLASLPDAERRDWLALWGEVDALIRKAGETRPR
jgi:eukaryotic-like serine/threonine-protein kinase